MKNTRAFVTIFLLVSLLLITTPLLYAQEPAGQPDSQGPTPTPTHPANSPIMPQIVGGNPTTINKYPWQVALISAFASNPRTGQFCGGSLIAPQWVLTAAHCVIESGVVSLPGDIDVVAGVTQLSSGPTSGGAGQRFDVAQVIPYPGYNEGTSDSDLALLQLAAPAALNSSVGVIGLVGPSNAALFAPGENAVVTGWGDMDPDPNVDNYPDDLHEVSVPIVDNNTCNASYGGSITNNMLCAGLPQGGQDSCQGDSGGPLVVPNGGGWLQAGVVSFGNGCAQPDSYGVYTRLANFKSWVDSNVTTANMANSIKTVSPLTAHVGETVTFQIQLVNSGSLDANVTLTDTLPASLVLPGSPTASSGSAPTVNGQTITWQGTVNSQTTVTISYEAQIVSGGSFPVIVNTVQIEADGQTYTRLAMVNPKLVYLPLVLK